MLGTPPAFVLSQDQTLKKLYLKAEALKSSFRIICLANILKNFRWLLFVLKRLNNPFIVKVFVRHCVIQFTRYRRYRCAVSLLTLPHHFPFVKNFFHFLSNFFFRGILLRRAPKYNIKASYFCQLHFCFFSLFFTYIFRQALTFVPILQFRQIIMH